MIRRIPAAGSSTWKSAIVIVVAAACGGLEPWEVDEAAEAVIRHLVESAAVASPPDDLRVICVSRREGFGGQPDPLFLDRFQADPRPVVDAARCEPAGDPATRWVLEGTEDRGVDIRLTELERSGDDRLRITAFVSNGPMDFAVHECSLLRQPAGWQVESCVATIMT